MNRILFVDDEPNVQEEQRRMLYSLRNEWDMKSVSSGAEAPMRRGQARPAFSGGLQVRAARNGGLQEPLRIRKLTTKIPSNGSKLYLIGGL